MSHGDFEVLLPPPGDDELGDLVNTLDTLRNQLAARMSELRGEGRKLRAIINGMSEGVALVQDVASSPSPTPRSAASSASAATPKGAPSATRCASPPSVTPSRPRSPRAAPASRVRCSSPAARSSPPSTRSMSRRRGEAVIVLIDVTEPKRLERLRREFVANASHELRTPVAAIVGVAEGDARRRRRRRSPEARSSFLEILMRHAQRLARRLTERPSSTSRASRPATRPRVEVVEVEESARPSRGCFGTLQVKGRAEEHHAFEKKLPMEPRVSAERAAVEQMDHEPRRERHQVHAGRRHGRGARRGAPAACASPSRTRASGIPKEHHARLSRALLPRRRRALRRDLGGTGPRPGHRQAPGARQRRRRSPSRARSARAVGSSSRCRSRYDGDGMTPV